MGSGKAKKQRRIDKAIQKEAWSLPPTIVVTGYPRSGTTTVMRMLFHGGIDIIAEDRDEKGRAETRMSYWPYGDAEVKNLDEWRNANPDPRITSGKAIKIITPYYWHYFTDRPMRVIFILRDLNEIVTSLLRMASVWAVPPDESIRYARKILTDIGVPTLYINYRDLLKYPKATATQIGDFIQRDFDVDNAIKAVDRKARTKMSDPSKEDLITFNFDYMRDYHGKEDDPVIALSEEAKKRSEEEGEPLLRKEEAA